MNALVAIAMGMPFVFIAALSSSRRLVNQVLAKR